jgi:hypothetical protein
VTGPKDWTREDWAGLQADLDRLEAEDPAVRAAAESYDATVRRILAQPPPQVSDDDLIAVLGEAIREAEPEPAWVARTREKALRAFEAHRPVPSGGPGLLGVYCRWADRVASHRVRLGRVQVYVQPRDLWWGGFVADDAVYACVVPALVARWSR